MERVKRQERMEKMKKGLRGVDDSVILHFFLRNDHHFDGILAFDLTSCQPHRLFGFFKGKAMGDHLLQSIFPGFS